MSRPLALLALALSAGLVLLGMPSFSGATYVGTTRNATSTVTAASDWTAPSVTVRNPGASVKDTVTVTADATDAESGVAEVVVQYLPDGASTWVTLCTATTAPYSCSWNTRTVADGSYQLRARATDRAGYTAVSEVVRTTVANAVVVVLDQPADLVRGTVPLTTSLVGGSSTTRVDVQYVLAGGTNWRTITGCAGLSSPFTCSWATTSFANDVYDLRAVAVTGTTSTTSAVVSDIEVDNLAPTATMTDPGSPLRGSVTFAATAADANSGVATVVLQYAVSGSSTWKELCTVTTAPYSCRFDTLGLSDGTYSVRAVATDAAGNTATSAAIANRIVDNTVSSVSLTPPAATLEGTVALSASANSTAGVTSVRIQRAPAGSSTWTDICTDTTAPYSCSWNTATVADGSYQLRAILLDGSGKTTISAVSSGHAVDNSPLRGVDVQATNGSGSTGRLDGGDVLRLTYSEQVNLSSISSGWNGSTSSVVVRLRDGNPLGLGAKGDTLDVLRTANGSVLPLGSVKLNEDYVRSNKTVQLNATVTASTVTVNGTSATQLTLVLGSVVSGSSSLRTVSPSATMQWTPSATATDLAGRACSVAVATESGGSDRDF